ncbi:MAG: sterol desaturase family protein [Oligoflexia bacterium]|nr:sterol desaturase family protein [Oligoflexia bacterium]
MIGISLDWILTAAKLHFVDRFFLNFPLIAATLGFLTIDIYFIVRTKKQDEFRKFRLDLLWFGSYKLTEFSAIVILYFLIAPVNPRIDFGNTSIFTLVLQFIGALFLFDLFHYALHRLRHSRFLWPFHMIHHSPQHLSIVSGTRVHPLETLIGRLIVFVPTAILYRTLPPAGIAGLVHLYYSFFTHINTSFSYGILEHVFVSPDVHKIHHWAIKDRYSCNYAQVFSLIDRVFGTLVLPKDLKEKVREIHGIQRHRGFPAEDYLPEENVFVIYIRQMLFPILQYRKLIGRKNEKS